VKFKSIAVYRGRGIAVMVPKEVVDEIGIDKGSPLLVDLEKEDD
jgi:hypothetical protein